MNDDVMIAILSELDQELAYFNDFRLLNSQRVKQMAKAFNDVDDLKKLLEEREKDLELAAKIGKTLLDKNRELQQTNGMLEQELSLATDQVTQLKHDLQQKVSLLHSVTDAESDFYYSNNKRDRIYNLKDLQKKLTAVEEENTTLKTEANHLKALTKELEEKEQQLVADCVKQLADANKQRSELSSRLSEQTEICTAQQQQIQFLTKEIMSHEENEAKLNLDNEEMRSCLFAARETQSELSQELLDLKERYAEITGLLREAHDEIDNLRSAVLNRTYSNTTSDCAYDSLASEMGISDPSPTSRKNTSSSNRAVAAICAVRNLLHKVHPASHSAETAERSKSFRQKQFTEKKEPNDRIVFPLVCGRMVRSVSSDSLNNYCWPGLGVPGLPGSSDLEYAIRRISLRQRFEREYRRYLQFSTRSPLLRAGTSCSGAFCSYLPSTSMHGLPDLLNSDDITVANAEKAVAAFHCKSNVELVKRFHGSTVLYRWKMLATPGFNSILQDQPSGILTQLNALLDPPTSDAAVKYRLYSRGDASDLITTVCTSNASFMKNVPKYVTGSVENLAESSHGSSASSGGESVDSGFGQRCCEVPTEEAGLNVVTSQWLSSTIAKPVITTTATTRSDRLLPHCFFARFKSKQKLFATSAVACCHSSASNDEVGREGSVSDSEALDAKLRVVTKMQLALCRPRLTVPARSKTNTSTDTS